MIFFTVLEDIVAENEAVSIQLKAPPKKDASDVPLANIYYDEMTFFRRLASTLADQGKARVFRIIPDSKIRSHPKCPVELGVANIGDWERIQGLPAPPAGPETANLLQQLEEMGKRTSLKIAIINGLGLGIGDSLVGLTALRAVHQMLVERYDEVIMDAFIVFERFPVLRPLYMQEPMIHDVLSLPASVAKLFAYDAVFDMCSLLARPRFDQMPLVDFFLRTFGLEPESVSPENKRNLVRLNENAHEEVRLHLSLIRGALPHEARKLLLFHPASTSPIRDIPEDRRSAIIKAIIDKSDYTVISAVQTDFQHERFFDLSGLSSSFHHFCALIAEADAIITVDTATYHIADGLDVPTVALFTTIPPEHRLQYYPLVKGILLDGAETTPYYGKHAKDKNIPLDEVIALWDGLDIDQVLGALGEMADKKENGKASLRCPICESDVAPNRKDYWCGYTMFGCSECEGEFASQMESCDYETIFQKGGSLDYSHYIVEGRTRRDVIDGTLQQVRFLKVAEILRSFPNKRTHLDVGCANGAIPAFTSDLGFESYGIDAAPSAIEYGRRVLGHRNLAVATALSPLPDHFPRLFQLITSFELVEHLADPNAFARLVRESLEEGGYWIFSSPNRDRLCFRAGIRNLKQNRYFGDYPPEHLTRWRGKTQRIFLERNGFELVDQFVTPLVGSVLTDYLGEFPNVDVNLAQGKMSLNKDELATAVFKYLAPLLNVIERHGLFAITMARKPGSAPVALPRFAG